MKKIFLILSGIFMSFALMNHGTAKRLPEPKQVTVKRKVMHDRLYFSGKLKPIDTLNITSPIEGVVVKKSFEYGAKLQKGQLVVELNSKQLAKDFNQALTSYLTSKDNYLKSRAKLDGSRELYKMGIISKNEYQNDESQFNQNHIEFLKSKYSLDEFLKYDDSPGAHSVESLTLKDFKHIDKAFQAKRRTLKISTPLSGVALMPDSSEATKKVEVGSQLKLGDVILSVGNLEGLSTELEVSEVDVVKIKPGQAVGITGVSFPGIRLEGKVVTVDSQATPAQGSGVPTFMVKVVVPKLGQEARERIKIGMSAKVTLDVSKKDVLLVPLEAVYERQHQRFVDILQKGRVQSRPVKTGQTLFDEVEVLAGLTEGDTIRFTPKTYVR